MKAVRIHEAGGPADLVFEDAPEPVLSPGDVLVKVCAAGFVPDELTWASTYVDGDGRPRTPSIPSHEVAGIVVQVTGDGGPAVGDRVFGLTGWNRDGAAAEYMAVEAESLAVVPESVSFVQAAALPLAGLTAYQGLFVHGELRPGQTVLVHGAGGGTGTLAVQLARQAGARVIATGRGRAAELAKEMGADVYVDLEHEELEAAVGLVDVVFDTIGGDILNRSPRLVRPGGALVSITDTPPELPVEGRTAFFIVEPDREQLTELARQAGEGRLRPYVGAVYPLAETREAFLAKGRGIPGKVVLQP